MSEPAKSSEPRGAASPGLRSEERATREGDAFERPEGERKTQRRHPRKRPILRRLLSSVLVFEAIFLILAMPVAITIEHLSHGIAFGVGGGLAVAAILLAGLVGRGQWALVTGTVLQFLIILAGIWVPALYVLGVIFCVLWFGGIRLANKLETPNPG
jgi:hypothetical protein